MKKTSVNISFDEEKLTALKMYLAQKNMQVESELELALTLLYTKTVPAGVRDFIEMKAASQSIRPAVKRPRKPADLTESDAPENAATEVTDNG